MACTKENVMIAYDYNIPSQVSAVKYGDSLAQIYVIIPPPPWFNTIRDLVKDDKMRINDAYAKAGFSSVKVPEAIKAAVKLHIYQRAEADVITHKPIYPVYGEWIYDVLCEKVFAGVITPDDPGEAKGRYQITDNLIVPSATEQVCIRSKLTAGRSLLNAFLDCGCSDIYYPPGPLTTCLEESIKGSVADFYQIYSACYNLHGLNKPEGVIIPPEPKKNNTLLYVVLGVGALLLLTRKA